MKIRGNAETEKNVNSTTQRELVRPIVPLDHVTEVGNVSSDIPKEFVTNGKTQENVSEDSDASFAIPWKQYKTIF